MHFSALAASWWKRGTSRLASSLRARNKRNFVLFFLIASAVLLIACAAFAGARPGGGQSYSGGSRSSSRSSGGGGGGGEGGGGGSGLFELLFWLVFAHPVIGIPLVIIVAVVLFGRSVLGSNLNGWSSGGGGERQVAQVQEEMAPAPGVPRAALQSICQVDPQFSFVLFEDFVYLLYAELHRARAGNPASIAAFISPQVAQSLASDPNLAEVRGIVIGAMRILSFSGVGPQGVSLELEFEANYVEVYRQGGERRFYVRDRMGLARGPNAKSRPAGRARTLDCPNCGAPLQNLRGTQCTYCQQDVGGGRFDWNVGYVATVEKELRGPLLTSNVAEEGTNEPTLVDPQSPMRMQALQQRDPSFNWGAFQQRAAHIFGALQTAWTAREPPRIRPFVSDNLFQSMVYWIDLYQQQRCRNVNEGARILRIDLANVLSDVAYDAITVRIFATGKDYTISDDGKLLSGSRSRERTYSEYWTFIRGAQRQGTSKGDQNCPNCGAPLNISMVGNCEYCQVKVTAGEFDWVLSRIEQDESYSG